MFDDLLDDIDIDIRTEIAKELEEQTFSELDDIDIREIVKEKAYSPEEQYAIEVYKQEREFKKMYKKMRRYISDGIAYYGKPKLSTIGGVLSILLLIGVIFLHVKQFVEVTDMMLAGLYIVAAFPGVLTHLVDNILIKHEHLRREDDRFNMLNNLRKELGLPLMVDKSIYLIGKVQKQGLEIIIYSLYVLCYLMIKRFDIPLMTFWGLMLGFLLILIMYQVQWGIRRGRSIRKGKDCVGTCVSKVRKLGFDNKVHTTGVFKIVVDDNTVEISSPYSGKKIEAGSMCNYYKIQGVFEGRIRYYFGVKPPTCELMVTKFLRILLASTLLGTVVYMLQYTELINILMRWVNETAVL